MSVDRIGGGAQRGDLEPVEPEQTGAQAPLDEGGEVQAAAQSDRPRGAKLELERFFTDGVTFGKDGRITLEGRIPGTQPLVRARIRIDDAKESPTRGQVFLARQDGGRPAAPERRLTRAEVKDLMDGIDAHILFARRTAIDLPPVLDTLRGLTG